MRRDFSNQLLNLLMRWIIRTVGLGLLGYLFLVLLGSMFLYAYFFPASQQNFAPNPAVAYDKRPLEAYQKAAQKSVDPDKPEQSLFVLPWGLLAAIDRVKSDFKAPVRDQAVEALKPVFAYENHTFETKTVIEVYDKKGRLVDARVETTSETKPLLKAVKAFNGVFQFSYQFKMVTTKDKEKTIDEKTGTTTVVSVTQEVAENDTFNFFPDYTTLDNYLRSIGLHPPQDRDFILMLADSFQGHMPEGESPYVAFTAVPGAVFPVGKVNAKGYVWPTPGYKEVTSPFGLRIHPIRRTVSMHKGIDIGAPLGAGIVAAKEGEILKAVKRDDGSGYGLYVVIAHPDGLFTLYAHMSAIAVSEGGKVKTGQLIGWVGSTGASTGPHLHFEVRPGNTSWVDPLSVVSP